MVPGPCRVPDHTAAPSRLVICNSKYHPVIEMNMMEPVLLFVWVLCASSLNTRHNCNVRGPERSSECMSCPARRPPTSFGFNTIHVATRAAPFSGPIRLQPTPAETNLHRPLRVASPGAQHSAEVLQLHLSPDHQGPPEAFPTAPGKQPELARQWRRPS